MLSENNNKELFVSVQPLVPACGDHHDLHFTTLVNRFSSFLSWQLVPPKRKKKKHLIEYASSARMKLILSMATLATMASAVLANAAAAVAGGHSAGRRFDPRQATTPQGDVQALISAVKIHTANISTYNRSKHSRYILPRSLLGGAK